MFVRDGGLMMTVQTLTLELSNLMAMPETVVIRKGMLALIAKEVRLAEQEIAEIRERYDVFSKEALFQAIQTGVVPEHPAWEDYIVWKNKEAHIAELRRMAEKDMSYAGHLQALVGIAQDGILGCGDEHEQHRRDIIK